MEKMKMTITTIKEGKKQPLHSLKCQESKFSQFEPNFLVSV